MTILKNFWREESGQDMVEYALLLAFVCLAAAIAYTTVGNNVKAIWENTGIVTTNANVTATAAAGGTAQ